MILVFAVVLLYYTCSFASGVLVRDTGWDCAVGLIQFSCKHAENLGGSWWDIVGGVHLHLTSIQ